MKKCNTCKESKKDSDFMLGINKCKNCIRKKSEQLNEKSEVN